jgi:hypothetical protein
MYDSHLDELFLTYPHIKENYQDLQENQNFESIYFYDAAKFSYLGSGWFTEYIIIGVLITSGIAVSSFLRGYFEESGRTAWEMTVELFKQVHNNHNRKKEFFHIKTCVNNVYITLLLDNEQLLNEELLSESYVL